MSQFSALLPVIIELTFICFYILGAGIYYYYWTQDYHPANRWIFQIFSFFTLIEVWDIYSKYQLNLSDGADTINFIVLELIRILLLLAFLYIFFWPNKKYFKSWEKMSDDDYLCQYIHFAELWQKRVEMTEDRELFEKGEKAYDMCWWIYFQLQKRGALNKSLEKLLKNKNDAVKILAARHLIGIQTEKSLKILDQIAARHGEIARVSKEWAQEWREGKIPPDSQILARPTLH